MNAQQKSSKSTVKIICNWELADRSETNQSILARVMPEVWDLPVNNVQSILKVFTELHFFHILSYSLIPKLIQFFFSSPTFFLNFLQ